MHWRKPTVHVARLRAAAPGSVFSLEGLFEYLLVEREVGDVFFEATILFVKLLKTLNVVRLHPAVLITPAMKSLLADFVLLADLRDGHAIRKMPLGLAHLANDLLGRVSLVLHLESPSPPSGR